MREGYRVKKSSGRRSVTVRRRQRLRRPPDRLPDRPRREPARRAAKETKKFEALTGDRLTELNRKLEKTDLEAISLPSREEWEAEQEGAAPSGTLARLVRAESGGWF